jgi:hypothetical protein
MPRATTSTPLTSSGLLPPRAPKGKLIPIDSDDENELYGSDADDQDLDAYRSFELDDSCDFIFYVSVLRPCPQDKGR